MQCFSEQCLSVVEGFGVCRHGVGVALVPELGTSYLYARAS